MKKLIFLIFTNLLLNNAHATLIVVQNYKPGDSNPAGSIANATLTCPGSSVPHMYNNGKSVYCRSEQIDLNHGQLSCPTLYPNKRVDFSGQTDKCGIYKFGNAVANTLNCPNGKDKKIINGTDYCTSKGYYFYRIGASTTTLPPGSGTENATDSSKINSVKLSCSVDGAKIKINNNRGAYCQKELNAPVNCNNGYVPVNNVCKHQIIKTCPATVKAPTPASQDGWIGHIRPEANLALTNMRIEDATLYCHYSHNGGIPENEFRATLKQGRPSGYQCVSSLTEKTHTCTQN